MIITFKIWDPKDYRYLRLKSDSKLMDC